MLKRMQRDSGTEAQIQYLESDFRVLVPGSYVICAISGELIPLNELRYWSFERQEAYIDAHASMKADLKARFE
ncbi:DUF2093 domain-containing protein [Candidatus Endowatersipora endosymbiont of Watersipora subatra]|uniref:DUF2093 domain-containing protein n=1 Tax=Candidatus Endowatersipora endosymbiont of Watersipora subatra TaxID=3077946 RepID=UPI00312C8F01